jgi:uncharacterized protein YukE
MKRLTKDQIEQHSQISTDLHAAHEAVQSAVAEFNAKVAAAYAELEPHVSDFNSEVEKANSFMGEVYADQESFYDEKSEKWQEGDAGEAYRSWMEQWEQVIEEMELDVPEELGEPDVDLDTFAQLPSKVES